MRLHALLLSALVVAGAPAAIWASGCSTYRSDLDRARAHYDVNEFEPALALLRVLEADRDSFSPAEHAQYAYTRGMTDYRLSALASTGNTISDPKQAFRSNARHWLAVARAGLICRSARFIIAAWWFPWTATWCPPASPGAPYNSGPAR